MDEALTPPETPAHEDQNQFDLAKELAWMDYEGLLDMEVEFVADLGQTTLSLKEII